MKKMLPFLLLFAFLFTHAQKHKLVQLWSSDAVVATPESVLPDVKNNKLYVSLIDGDPWGVDGKGGLCVHESRCEKANHTGCRRWSGHRWN